jgi:protein SCO1/2
MEKMTRRIWLAAAGTTTAAAGATVLFGQDKTTNNKQFTFQNISPRELIQRRHLPNVELITQDNLKVHFYNDLVKDRRVVIQFMFTRCKDICPMITHHMAEVQKILKGRVGSDIFFYSISLSPEEDTPRDLKAYARLHHAGGPGWTFLTGKPDDILLLRKSLGFFYDNPKEDADRNNHSGMLVVGTEPLMRWAMCEGGADPKWIATVIQTEADSPFKGAVDGIRQDDPAVHLKPSSSPKRTPKRAMNGRGHTDHMK